MIPPINRKELQELIKHPETISGTRLDCDSMFYETFCEYIPDDIKDFILDSQIQTAMDLYKIYTSALLTNPFWYSRTLSVMQNTKHFCLWIPKNTNPSPRMEIRKWVKALFPNRFQDLEFDFYQNTQANKSVKNREHFQVFIYF